jgi:ABC-type bacteriocin/lantibiotic exporter with double-glycine peptidase domain
MRRRLQLPGLLPLLPVAFASLAGCAPAPLEAIRAHAARGDAHLIDGVPFLAQEALQCGPAALAMILRYHGVRVDPDTLAKELYLPSAGGALNVELELRARRLGFRTRAFEASLEAVKPHLRAGHPLLVLLDLGQGLLPVPHFAVLLGYDDRAGVVVLHSGPTPHAVVAYPAFARAWAARRGWTLLVTPSGPPA